MDRFMAGHRILAVIWKNDPFISFYILADI